MKLKLIEPLKFLFKDEVRELGAEIGLPEDLIWRQPFPGPGLGIRIMGEITRERLAVLRDADAIGNIRTRPDSNPLCYSFRPDFIRISLRPERSVFAAT